MGGTEGPLPKRAKVENPPYTGPEMELKCINTIRAISDDHRALAEAAAQLGLEDARPGGGRIDADAVRDRGAHCADHQRPRATREEWAVVRRRRRDDWR